MTRGTGKTGLLRLDMCWVKDESMHAMSHGEIAVALGISRGRVWQLERSGLRKLRARLEALGVAEP